MNGSNNKKYKLLIVDDVAENLHSMMNILRDNYSLLVATNGEKALELAENEPKLDLILLDIKMPGMDGYEVLQRLKSNPATEMIPVIFVTAMSEATDEARGLNLGAADYITKPVNAELLKSRVLTQLELKHYRRSTLAFDIDGQALPTEPPAILIVDDVPENVHSLVGALSNEYRIIVAETGEKAIRIVNGSHPPDLILLDIRMPGMDGFEVCSRIKADEAGQNIPVIFLSVLQEAVDKVRGFSVGGEDYITKPFDIDEVNARIRTHLELRKYRLHLEALVKQRTEELLASEKNFRQAQKMEALGTLVGGIAHDFNNILAGITGAIYMAKHSPDNPEMVNKSLTSINDLSFRAADMIKQLLAFSRQEKVSKSMLPLTPFIKEASKLIRIGIDESILFNSVLDNKEMFVRANSTQVQQLLFNLVNNARDAVEHVKNPEITVRLERFEADDTFSARHSKTKHAQFAMIEVQDNGEGIQEENLERLFDPFFTTKETGKGTGLGLAMAYSTIRDHGGFVEVNSTVGKGTCFKVYLPLEESAVHHIDSGNDEICRGSDESLLLVDDDLQVQETTRAILVDLGYQVSVASNGKEAIDLFSANSGNFDLVIMDVVIPIMSGPDAASEMRKIKRGVKIIFLTGYDSKGTLASQLTQGKDVLLNKPCSISQLSRTIREQLT